MPRGHDTHAMVGAYVLDAVLDNERAVVERHLAECATCAREVAEMREVVTWLAFAADASAPPQRLRAAVLAAVRGTRRLRWIRRIRRRADLTG